MADSWQVLMPKTQIFRSFTQSTGQAMALDPDRRTTLRLRAEFEDVGVDQADLTIEVEEAVLNEETAFVASGTAPVALGNNAATPNTQAVQPLAFSGRFVRLKITANLNTTTWANIQAEVLVQ